MAVIILEEPRRRPPTPQGGFALFSLGFRPFYLLAALWAVVAIPAWIATLTGHLAWQGPLPPILWHGHEMLFGFATAVIVGFLFTAVRNWTGLATPKGAHLAAIALLWLAARIALVTGPLWLAALLDLAFLPWAAVVIGRLLLRARTRRNYFLMVLLLALTAANALVYASAAGLTDFPPLRALDLAVALITVLETVIAGRIVPGFTANAARVQTVRHVPLDQAAIVLTLLALFGWAWQIPMQLVAPVAAAAAIAQAWRSWLWRPLATLRVPLLWVLHLAHAWIVVALLLIALHGLGWNTLHVVTHVLTVGAMAGLILGMITRTALGHTGRMLKGGRIETAAYVLLALALLARVLPPLLWPAVYVPGLWLAVLAWCAAFGLYIWRYLPMLVRPRADGRSD
ncbi:MAG: NnrS family protein [Rhodocyclaceae bacterium]